jgi:pyridoxamine 5'-phosphate oxidase
MDLDLSGLRNDYQRYNLSEDEVHQSPDAQFIRWFDEACRTAVNEPSAFVLSTVSASGQPSSRVVLLKGIEEGRFLFFTDYKSQKGQDLETNNLVAMVFFWPLLERQVRIEGKASKLDRENSERYFRSRPYESRVAAFTSRQSTEVPSRAELESGWEATRVQYPDDVPCPTRWGGYAVDAHRFEFWQGRTNRLHDRIIYLRKTEKWVIRRLMP